MMRRAIVETLTKLMDLDVCGEAATEAAGLRLIDHFRPDLALIDLTLEDGHGLSLLGRARAASPGTRLLVYSMCDDDLIAERAIRAGAAGYLNKQAPTRRLRQAIDCVLAGELFVSGGVAHRLEDVRRSGENA